jgi:hypothetical protein
VKFGDKPPIEIKSKEVWTLLKRGKKLSIVQTSADLMVRGPSTTRMIYDKY